MIIALRLGILVLLGLIILLARWRQKHPYKDSSLRLRRRLILAEPPTPGQEAS